MTGGDRDAKIDRLSALCRGRTVWPSAPVIHFAAREDAAEHVHQGPALCGAGWAARREDAQTVTGVWDAMTCQDCARVGRALLREGER